MSNIWKFRNWNGRMKTNCLSDFFSKKTVQPYEVLKKYIFIFFKMNFRLK